MRRFELIIEDDGIGNQNIKATNDGFLYRRTNRGAGNRTAQP